MKFTIIKSCLAPFSGIVAVGTPSNIHGTAISYRCANFGAFVNSVTILTLRDLTIIMMGLVIGVFLVCYGMYLRCSFTILFHTTSCKDENYKIPFLVLNSAINPLVYAFFKRDRHKERV